MIGYIAHTAGYLLNIQVLKSSAGYYLGTKNRQGVVSRESEEHWQTEQEALEAYTSDEWTQRVSLNA